MVFAGQLGSWAKQTHTLVLRGKLAECDSLGVAPHPLKHQVGEGERGPCGESVNRFSVLLTGGDGELSGTQKVRVDLVPIRWELTGGLFLRPVKEADTFHAGFLLKRRLLTLGGSPRPSYSAARPFLGRSWISRLADIGVFGARPGGYIRSHVRVNCQLAHPSPATRFPRG
jgi:hypothetical protein